MAQLCASAVILKDVNSVANAVLLRMNAADSVGGMLCCVEETFIS